MSSAEPPGSLPFVVPSADVRRQAIDVWRGFEYQLFQALHAWLKLTDDAVLFLEVAEDHATLAGNQIEQTQVKDTKGSGNISLRSDPVVNLIESHWRLREANPAMNIASVLLTTTKPGKESGASFPDGNCGLDYWRVAGRDGTEVAPLRGFLLTLNLSESLNKFVRESTDEQLRSNLIRPIKWICCSDELDTIRQSVLDSLVCLGGQRGVPALESERAADSLIAELKDVILRKDVRKVTRADLFRTFDKATLVSVPRAVAEEGAMLSRGLGASSSSIIASTVGVRNAGRIPLPPRVASRTQLVADMSNRAARRGILWLHGSSGLGKSTLALLMARMNRDQWLFVDLRDCSAQDTQKRLLTAAQIIGTSNVRGIIVDDYAAEASGSTLLSLAQLAMEAYLQDVTVILTSSRVPAPTVVSRLGDERVELCEIPYLSEEDVAVLVVDAGGDAGKWAKVIHAFSGSGHPQLVDAKITGLKSRGWPDSEILTDIAPAWSSKEIRAEKEAVTVRLMKELPDNARELLYRLSLAMNGFDRRLALAIAEAKEAVPRPGEAFKYLHGPWVESRGEDQYALSPLVSSCGSLAISSVQQSAVRKSIVADLIQRRPFPGEQLGQLLVNAFIEQEAAGLIWFAEAMFQYAISDWDTFRRLAQQVSAFSAFSTTQPLFASNDYVSTMLRIVQLFVALETAMDKVPVVFDQTIEECRQLSDKRVSAGLITLCVSKLLIRQGTGLSPARWFPLVQELPQLIKQTGKMEQAFADASKHGMPDWTIDQFLFVVQASSSPSVDALSNLIDQLNRLKGKKRSYYLSALDKDFRGRRLMVDNAWLNQTRLGDLDGSKAAAQYAQIATIAKGWGERDLQIDCICAQAVMLDEYADRSQDAIALLDDAVKSYGPDHRLLRRRQVVLLGQGDHEAALQAFPSVAEGYSHDPIDLIYSFRDAGRSASEIGNLREALKFFREAAAAADRASQPMIPMSAGLLADAAVVALQDKDYGDALGLMKQAILKAEQIGPDPSGVAKYCLIALGHLGALMLECAEAGTQTFDLKAGVCSNPNPDEDILEREAPAPLMLWYQLAILESKLNLDVGGLLELRKRTTESNYFGLEFMLIQAMISAACKSTDIDALLHLLPIYLALNARLGEQGNQSNEDFLKLGSAPIVPIGEQYWSEPKYFPYLGDVLTAFALLMVACDRTSTIDTLVDKLSKHFPSGTKVADLLSRMLADPDGFPTEGLTILGGACVSWLRKAKEKISAERALGLTYYLWVWLRHSSFKRVIENDVAQCMSLIWRRVISECRFMLMSPAVTVPWIESVLDGATTGAERLAALVLASESATASSFNESMRKELREFLDVAKGEGEKREFART